MEKSVMRIAITGSSGYVGNFLAEYFSKKGIHVVGLANHSIPQQKHLKDFKFVDCDVRNKSLLKETFEKEKITHVIHLAYLMNPQHDKKFEYDVDVNGSKACFDAANEVKSVKQLILFSSASIYGAFKDNKDWTKESSPLRPRDWVYAQYKKIVEAYYRSAKRRKDLRLVIFRMCTAVGPSYYKRGGVVSYLAKSPLLMLINGIDTKLQFIHEDDVKKLVDLVVHDSKVEGIFNLSPDSYCTQRQVGRRKFFVYVPKFLIYSLVWLFWNLRLSPLSPTAINLTAYGIVMSPEKLMKRYNYHFEYSSAEAFFDAVEKRKKNGTL